MSILIYFAVIFWSLFPNLIHVFQGGEDYINKVNEINLISNGGFSDGTTGWITESVIQSVEGGINTITSTSSETGHFGIYKWELLIGIEYYGYVSINPYIDSTIILGDGSPKNYNLILNVFNGISNIFTTTSPAFVIYQNVNLGDTFQVDNVQVFNISQMKINGIKDDNGILFSDLTNEEIRLQLDQWITEYVSLDFTITKDNTYDRWFNTGFVEKTAERDFIDYLGYFFWLMTPPIILFATFDLIRRVL